MGRRIRQAGPVSGEMGGSGKRWKSFSSLTTTATLLLSLGVVPQTTAIPPPPQKNDIFGTVNGCTSALIEMDDNQDGRLSRGEYLDFVNLLADFLCLPERPILDLEIQTVFYSIACLCQEREGFDSSCCFGGDAGIYTKGAADAVTRTEEDASYLRAACLLTQAILGPQQCEISPQTLSPGAVTIDISRFRAVPGTEGLSDEEQVWLWLGLLLALLLCCVLVCCQCRPRKDEEEEEIITKVDTKVIVEELPVLVEEAPPSPGPVEPYEVAYSVPPPQTSFEPKEFPSAGAPAILPVPTPFVAPPPPPDDSSEESDNIGRKLGVDIDDDEEGSFSRKFKGQGMLPMLPVPAGIRLRHVEVEKEEPSEIEYPEREFYEYKEIPDEDSVQEFEPYIPDCGVHDPKRPVKPPVVFNPPKYVRPVKKEPELFDPRKMRKQMGYGDGEVWDALVAHEEEREQSKFRFTGMWSFATCDMSINAIALVLPLQSCSQRKQV